MPSLVVDTDRAALQKSGAGPFLRISAALTLLGLVSYAAAQPASLPDAVVTYAEFDRTTAVEAVVEAVRQTTLAAQVAGRVIALPVKAGDVVRRNQRLAQIDARVATLAEAATQSQVREARANLDNAKAKYDRTQRLALQKFVSAAAVDQARSEFLAAQAQVETAVANASQAATSRDLTSILAPYDGVVASTDVELGDMATPGRPLLTLFDPSALRVTAVIPEAVLAQTKLEASLAVEIPALKSRFTVTRTTLIPTADSRTHTARVRFDLAEAPGVMPGQYARVLLVTGRARALVIPESAVMKRSELTAVYVLDKDGRAHLRQVRVGQAAGEGRIEVLAGLYEGERIARDPVRAGIEASSSHAPRS